MSRKSVLIICLLLLELGIVVPNALAARVVLSVPAYYQQQDGWCWAAADKSIIQYCEGSSPSLQTIVNYIPGGDEGATMAEARDALNHWNVTTSLKYDALTYSGLQWQINNNRPIWARQSNGGGFVYRHAHVVRGYDTSTNFVLFVDPADGDYHGQTYSTYLAGVKWNGVWSEWDGSIFDCQ